MILRGVSYRPDKVANQRYLAAAKRQQPGKELKV